MWFVINFPFSLHVIKPNICPWSWILALKCMLCLARRHFMKNVAKSNVPLQLEIAGGELTLDTIGDGIVWHGCVFNPLLTVSLFSTARGEKDGYFFERRPEGSGMLKGPNGSVKPERSGELDYLVDGEKRSAFTLCSHLALSMQVIVECTTQDI